MARDIVRSSIQTDISIKSQLRVYRVYKPLLITTFQAVTAERTARRDLVISRNCRARSPFQARSSARRTLEDIVYRVPIRAARIREHKRVPDDLDIRKTDLRRIVRLLHSLAAGWMGHTRSKNITSNITFDHFTFLESLDSTISFIPSQLSTLWSSIYSPIRPFDGTCFLQFIDSEPSP